VRIGILGWDHGEIDLLVPALVSVGPERGHDTSLFTLDEVGYAARPGGLEVMFGETPGREFDAVISRANLHDGDWRERVERLALVSGVPGVRIFDPVQVWIDTQSKFRTTQLLCEAGVPVLPTRCVTSRDEVAEAVAEWDDVIIKPSFGYRSRDCERITDVSAQAELIDDVIARNGIMLAQPFVSTANGEFRITVVGDDTSVLNATKTAKPGGWETRRVLGGSAQNLPDPPQELRDLAVRAARATGNTVAGVDILPTADGGYVVLEVNSVPAGFELFDGEAGITTAARAFYDAVEKLLAVG
jgi:ribosomal protein S6--L-glutamate ligase